MDIERLVQLAYPGENHPFLEQFKIEAFVNGIRDSDVKYAVCATQKSTFAETVSFALAQETAKMIAKPQRCMVRNIKTVVDKEKDIISMVIEALRQVMEEKKSKPRTKCYNCGKVGHLQRSCRAPRRQRRGGMPSRSEPREKQQSSQKSSERASTAGHKQSPTTEGPTISISIMQQENSNLTACGYIGGRKHTLTIDTGASQSIIRPDLVKKPIEPLSGISLRTATGEPAAVYGKVRVKLTIGNVSVYHVFVVADIVDEVIIGADFMIRHGISLHMRQRVMKWRNVRIPLVVGYKSEPQVRTLVTERYQEPPSQPETVMWSPLVRDCEGSSVSTVKPVGSRSSPVTSETLVWPAITGKDDRRPSCEGRDLLVHDERTRVKVTENKIKARYDRAANSEGFTEGQLVLLFNPQRKKGLSPKLQTHWDGPYKVIKRINDVVYRIQKYKSPRSKMKVVHLERLAPYGKGELMPIRDEQA